jgi:hypothetical protein
MHFFCVTCLDHTPCPNKEGSFRWGFCTKSVFLSKMRPFFAWPRSGIAAWLAWEWDPLVRPRTDFGSAKAEANTNKRFIFIFYKEKDENYL